jgi:phosphatidylethanolamine-binding protein (PEBP) family uncharacterized protein
MNNRPCLAQLAAASIVAFIYLGCSSSGSRVATAPAPIGAPVGGFSVVDIPTPGNTTPYSSGGNTGTGAGGSGGASGSGGSSGSGGTTPPGDGSIADTSPPPAGDGGTFTVTGDFSMMGDRLCFKTGTTLNTGGKSPAIMWSGAPPETMSFVVTLKDLTLNAVHWIGCNIPPATMGLPASISMATLPTGAAQSSVWYGPGANTVNRYEYKVWPMKAATLPGAGCANRTQAQKNTLYNQLAALALPQTATVIAWGNAAAACM